MYVGLEPDPFSTPPINDIPDSVHWKQQRATAQLPAKRRGEVEANSPVHETLEVNGA